MFMSNADLIKKKLLRLLAPAGLARSERGRYAPGYPAHCRDASALVVRRLKQNRRTIATANVEHHDDVFSVPSFLLQVSLQCLYR